MSKKHENASSSGHRRDKKLVFILNLVWLKSEMDSLYFILGNNLRSKDQKISLKFYFLQWLNFVANLNIYISITFGKLHFPLSVLTQS